MKKMLYLLLFVIMIASAFATFDLADVKLGGTSQERGETASVQVNVKNVGSKPISSIYATFSGVAAKYAPNATFSSQSIPINGSVTMTVKGYVPLDQDAVDSNGAALEANLGSLVVKGKYSDSSDVADKAVKLLMQAENKLEFTSDTSIIYEADDSKLSDGKTYDDVKRGDEVTLEIEVENRFDDKGDCEDDGTNCDINDIEIEFEPKDSDFDDDSTDTDDISADDTDTATITFDVPDDVDKGDYEFELYVTGTDENGALHGDIIEFTLDVTVEKDEISIISAELSPSMLECTERRTTLSVKIENTGTRDQDKASIFVESAKLGINEQIFNLDLNDGKSLTQTFELSLPKNIAAGSYPITIRANYDADEETDVDSVTLVMDECFQPPVDDTEDDTDDSNGSDDDSNTDVNIIQVPPNTGVVVGEEKESFFDSPQYVMMLAGLFLLALLVFFVLVVLLLRK